MKIDLKGLNASETREWVESLGIESYRAKQIRQWLFKRLVSSFDEMTNISISLRNLLKEKARITNLEKVAVQVSKDTTEKYLFRLHDGHFIESVLIPERDHYTLCISSQAGCSMGCAFCHTARLGLKRNLSPAEIIDQVIEIKRSMKDPDGLTNIVFMGMGEPLANYEAVLTTLDNLISDDGMNFSHRKVTLSTSGLVPLIDRLGRDTTVNLAVSLNAADDETRNRLMPINRKYNLESLMSACRNFPLPNRRMITFEYILIKGINDRSTDAINLVKLLKGIRAKVNLIPLNPGPDPAMTAPPLEDILAFQDILAENHYTAIIRKSKGQDISAACGQLSGAYSPSIKS
jgi:23S rRNA (adenine2503-C2)-methyltransferase